jgi:uncharacterized Zn finger protein
VLIIVRFPKRDHVSCCQDCGHDEFELKYAKGWKYAYGCKACGRIKHATQECPTFEQGNIVVTLIKTEGAKR